MSQIAAFAPLTQANGLVPPTIVAVTVGGTAVQQNLATVPPDPGGNPQQVLIYNPSSVDAQLNFGVAGTLVAVTPTTGVTCPHGSMIDISLPSSYNAVSGLLGASGTGNILIWNGAGL